MKDLKVIKIKTKKPYKVFVKDGIIYDITPFIKDYIAGKNVLVVSDDIVAPLYLNYVETALKKMGKTVYSFVIKNGEQSKNFETYKAVIDYLCEKEFTRKDFIIALGGGVVGDLSGFIASSYLRGIAFAQIPTTLLSAVDSSVGGKTGIDTKKGKNLVGAFYSPKVVIIDSEIIKNLPKPVFIQGYGEVVKYTLLDKKIYKEIKKPNCDYKTVIALCVLCKNKIVSKDEFEKGKRKLLNLGHTYAHAVEKLSGYTVPHGIAVIMGVKKITEYADRVGLCDKITLGKVNDLIKNVELPNGDYALEEVIGVIKSDKKRQGEFIDLVIPTKIGKAKIIKTKIEDLRSIYANGNDK